jgi:arabinofuranosyltransferase
MFQWSQARDRSGPGLSTFLGSRFALIVLLLLQGALTLVLAGEHGRALVDDAYISFRYADRWAHGHGWTWNDGSRVEGFSNPLWTYLLGAADRAGLPPHRLAGPLGILCALATTLLLARATRRFGSGNLVWVLVSGGCALDVGLGVWAGSGLETSLAALCLALLLCVSLEDRFDFRRGLYLGLAGTTLLLVRPEGFLWAGWTAIWLIWGAWAPGPGLLGFASGLLPAGFVLIHRLRATGSLLPNPFFAKLEPSALGLPDALRALGGWTLAHAAWIALVLLLAGRRRRPSPHRVGADRWVFLPAGLVLAQVLFVLGAGGDWMGRTRYLVPLLPAFYLLGASVLGSGDVPVTRRWGTLGVGLTLAAHLALGWGMRDRIPTYTREGEVVGRWLKRTAAPGDTLAVTASGAIPYFSGLPTLDVLGLNDPRVRRLPPRHRGAWAPGHHRYDIDRLLAEAPVWIVWDFGIPVNRHRILTYRDWPADDVARLDYRRELFAHPEFQARYEIDTSAPRETQSVYTVFRRK